MRRRASHCQGVSRASAKIVAGAAATDIAIAHATVTGVLI
jgi:hypothetical protein